MNYNSPKGISGCYKHLLYLSVFNFSCQSGILSILGGRDQGDKGGGLTVSSDFRFWWIFISKNGPKYILIGKMLKFGLQKTQNILVFPIGDLNIGKQSKPWLKKAPATTTYGVGLLRQLSILPDRVKDFLMGSTKRDQF